MRRYLPDKNFFISKLIPGLPGNYVVVEHCHSGGNGHLFRAHSDEMKHDLACKIIPRQNLRGATDEPPAWLGEIQKANTLQHQSVVKVFPYTLWQDPAANIDCVAFCAEFINGPNLRDYVRRNAGNISMLFVVDFLKTMLSFFDDMARHEVRHGDLHSENVLVEDRSNMLGSIPHAFRVTDFGVVSATGDRTLRDDYEQLAGMLKELLEEVNYQAAPPQDKYAFNTLNDWLLPRGLIETDATREPCARNPRLLFERLLRLDADFTAEQGKQERAKLTTPFDYLNCEQIGENHSLLKALYSEKFLGLKTVQERNNLLLTGPRGCGKSTVFKSLSLRHRLLVDEDRPDKIDYVGVYYRCDDLYFAFPRYVLPRRKAAFDIPMHFLTATLLIELLETITLWGERHFVRQIHEAEAAVARGLWSVLEISAPSEPGANRLRTVADKLRRERKRAAEDQRYADAENRGLGAFFGPEVLLKACEVLSSGFPFLQQRPCVFFIDDYSAPKITFPLQESLNRLVMQRAASCFFKLSTESPVSYTLRDIDNKTYVEKREYVLLNLGLTYLHGDPASKLAFIEDIFSRRLQAVPDYPAGDLDVLVGGNLEINDNAMARALRNKEKPKVWGRGALARLCSGDIHYLIDLVGKMVELAGGLSALRGTRETPKVPADVQADAVRKAAGDFLQNLSRLPRGKQLVEIVNAFGSVARSFLQYRDSKNEGGNPPHQASRVEPYEPLNLTQDEQAVYNELLRYSVFIEDDRGKSRRGKAVPRLYLRRFLIPHFNLTFSMRDSLELEPEEFKELLTSPTEFEKKHRLRDVPQDGASLFPSEVEDPPSE